MSCQVSVGPSAPPRTLCNTHGTFELIDLQVTNWGSQGHTSSPRFLGPARRLFYCPATREGGSGSPPHQHLHLLRHPQILVLKSSHRAPALLKKLQCSYNACS